MELSQIKTKADVSKYCTEQQEMVCEQCIIAKITESCISPDAVQKIIVYNRKQKLEKLLK